MDASRLWIQIFFVALDSQDPGVLYVDLDEQVDLEEIRKLAKTAAESPFSVALEIWIYGRHCEKCLVNFEDTKLTDLTIQFSWSDWIESFSDHRDYVDDLLKDAEIFGERVNITADFPHLKRLALHLTSPLDQESQLKSFCRLESLEEVQLTGMSAVGVDFMIKTKEQWPRKVEFEFDDDVSQELKELLWQYFDSTYKFDRW